MFLRNFDNIMLLMLSFGVSPIGSAEGWSMNNGKYILGTDFIDGNISVKTMTGNIKSYYPIPSSSNCLYYTKPYLSLDKETIILGDGDTEVTYDDYKLSGNNVTNKLTKISNTVTYDSTTKKYTNTFIASYNNTTEDTITIKEWGTKDTCYNNTYLLTREVLPEPVVIEPGETATLTFQLTVGLMHQV